MIWEYSDVAESLIEQKSEEWQFSKCLTRLLLNRGIGKYDEVKEFIDPDIDKFRDPFDFERMNEVVQKIIKIKEKGGKIFVYGDYDVDGITSAVFLVHAFRELGMEVDYYIPNRMEEGYGLDRKAINYIDKKKGKLIITVDTGINSVEDVKYAKKLGIDVIITDHHKIVKEEGDEKLLIINPKFSDKYQFKFLAGAGVALKVAQAVYIELEEDLERLYQYIDIVMIGTVADVVPMIDENRIIIRKGLEIIKKTRVKGLVYLMKYLRLQNKKITTTDISFFISPLLNSLGRIGTSRVGADFFINDDDFEIYNIIEEMKKSNKKRRELERSIFNDIDSEIQKMEEKNFKYLFLKSSKWHPGVIGVVSSRLSIKYHVPVVLIAMSNGIGKASCRSIEGTNIFNILSGMSEKLLRFGGHDLAAGFIARNSDLEEIEKGMKEYLGTPDKNKILKHLKVDGIFPIEKIDENMLKDLERLSPYGLENEPPIFLDENLEFENLKKFGVENRHFKTFIRKDGRVYSAVAFDLGHKIDESGYKLQNFDIVYYPEKVYYRGEESLQIKIKDFKVKDNFNNIFTK
jgi:single-stranded-DNA-specific exonuclease